MKSSRAFTLIELLVVITVIGILAGALLAVINPLEQLKKARDAQKKHDLSQIQKALEVYYNDNGKYPDSIPWGNTWSGYMEVVPQDPSYSYTAVNGGYKLSATLDICSPSQTNCNPYSVTSPNSGDNTGVTAASPSDGQRVTITPSSRMLQ